MKRAILVLVVLVAVTAAVIWWLRGIQQADPSYVPSLARRTWPAGGPVVVIDDAHWNVHTAARGYVAFVKLLAADGYTVIEKGNATTPEMLKAARIVVIANALGFRGVVRQVGQIVGLNLEGLSADAFSDSETSRLEDWVRGGGSLLLVADHSPAGRAAQSVAERFGVTMRDGFVFDPAQSEASPSFIVFSREGKTLATHPIIDGRGADDSVGRVVTFTGQALDGPANATKLLMFSGTAYQVSRRDAGPEDRVPVAGLGQAVALTHGQGRVVVLGEAAVLTSQVLNGGGDVSRIGLTWPKADNELFARHIMQWLSHAGE